MTDRDGESLWPKPRFKLMWRAYGGQGLGMQWSEVNELDLADARDLYEQMSEQIKAESDALESASRKP